MKQLHENLRFLCDETRMLTGISVAYGTAASCETLLYGHAQETRMTPDGAFLPYIRPLTEDSLFDLASLTKLFTCTLAMQLIERGQLSFEETIGRIDSRFIHLQNVSVHDVMSFRVSLQTAGRIDDAPTRDEGLHRLFMTAAVEPPRIRLYSDINAMVMKYVIEQKTHMPFADSLNKYIFAPLGMNDTHAEIPKHIRNRCVCYSYEHRIFKDTFRFRSSPEIGRPHDPKALLLSDNGNDLCGHAGLFSTRADMIRFAQALIGGELLRPTSLSAIGTNYTGMDYGDGTHRQYLGLLCFTKHPNQTLSEVPAWMTPGSFGISGFTGNHLSIDPNTQLFVLFLGNRCHDRVSNIQLLPNQNLTDHGLSPNGTGCVSWPNSRRIPSSARYVYFKDELLNDPIYRRMQALDWA